MGNVDHIHLGNVVKMDVRMMQQERRMGNVIDIAKGECNEEGCSKVTITNL